MVKSLLSEPGAPAGLLSRESGELQYEITGALDRDGKPILRISVQGLIKLRCQRCLGELGHVLDLRTDLRLAENENELSLLMKMNRLDGILAEPDTGYSGAD